MKIVVQIIFVVALLISISAQAANSVAPTFELEKKIAYQQGHFGALYARCGTPDDRAAVIGGTLANWRMETFRGYNGTSYERAGVEQAFDQAANDVAADANSCQGWIKQAAATWHNIVSLSQYGVPVAAN